jgi:CheY-like chemotaxis protein
VAKILVADDNSNVQKTMTLALAHLGVEVISVNNGEAAVRKLADVTPDMVLADIFMPVRNGYEVCEFVKRDPRFTHVPVVLLVGAFDPLDEREAQRVGADGILKKPFVPPDPLITMVKTLLDRAMGERLVAVSVTKTVVAAQAKTGTEATAEVHAPVPPILEELSPEEFPIPAGRVSFGDGDHPVAFGQLLETPRRETAPSDNGVIETVDDEQILTSSRDATLGEPIFWRNDSPEAEPDVAQPADSPDELSLSSWSQQKEALPRQEDAGLMPTVEPLELVREEQEATAPSVVDSEPIILDAAAQAPLTVESGKARELAANPIEWLATAPAQHSDAASETTPGLAEPIADVANTIDAVGPSVDSVPAMEPKTQSANETVAEVLPQSPQTPEDTARSVPIHKWGEMTECLEERASELAAQYAASMSEPSAQIPAPAPAISQAAAVNPPQPPNPSGSEAPDPELVEAVVRRVLDKMRPQVVDIITREFLRPVVQALVHREIEKK